jgi:hypothetical protein
MIAFGPHQMAWLKSIVHDGPTAFCFDGVASALVAKGCARRMPDNKLEATDLGRQCVRAVEGQTSTLCQVSQ